MLTGAGVRFKIRLHKNECCLSGGLRVSDFHRPTELAEALVIAAGGARLAAGCTDLLAATQAPQLAGAVLDLTAIADLRGIEAVRDGWRIGALTTWADVQRADLPAAFDGLKAAAREVGGVQIQNAGTLGGNICNASPAADGLPCLLSLDAEVELASVGGLRRLGLGQFVTGPRRTAIRPGEVLTAIHVPSASGRGRGAFLKLGARRYLVISIAMVAVRVELEAGLIRRAAISVGACSPVALRLPEQEAALVGVPVSEAVGRMAAVQVAAALAPISDLRADASYRAHAAVELLRRALEMALAPARVAA